MIMNRRKSIKTLFAGGISVSVIAEACKSHENSPVLPDQKTKKILSPGLTG